MRTQLSMFDATSITIEEKRGDDEPNETVWTDITVRSGEGDVIEFTVFDCPPIQVGKDGNLCADVIAELADLENSDLESREQLRADYRTEVIRSQDRYRRAKAAEDACQQLRDSLVAAESALLRYKKTNDKQADNIEEWADRSRMLEDQIADLQAEARGQS